VPQGISWHGTSLNRESIADDMPCGNSFLRDKIHKKHDASRMFPRICGVLGHVDAGVYRGGEAMRVCRALFVAVMLVGGVVRGGECVPTWSGAFASGGVQGRVEVAEVFDDGTGPALYVAGSFGTAGGTAASRIAKWDGLRWSPLGSGLNNQTYSMAVFDDGTGSSLYVSGAFGQAGGVSVQGLAKWNGTAWSAVSAPSGQMFDLCVYDDGTGPALYAAGRFDHPSGSPFVGVMRRVGGVWQPLSSSMNSYAAKLAVYDDGNGPSLYACGQFSTINGVAASGIAKWNGTNWEALGSGLVGSAGAMVGFHDGTSTKLYVAGNINSAGGQPVSEIASWDGTNWAPVGGGLNDDVWNLYVWNDGSASRLYACGSFTMAGGQPALSAASWNGLAWSPLGTGLSLQGSGRTAAAFAAFDSDGAGPESEQLYTCGQFVDAGGVATENIARWNGSTWNNLNGSRIVRATAPLSINDGSGLNHFMAGTDGESATNEAMVFRLENGEWVPFTQHVQGTINAMVYADAGLGDGPQLCIGGSFATAGGQLVNNLARWNGSIWQPFGIGLGGSVLSMLVFDDGSGPGLYIAGADLFAGPPSVSVVKWTPFGWLPLDPPLGNAAQTLTVFDDGTGPALYVGGDFRFNDSHVVKWTGSGWIGLGNNLSSRVYTLAVFDGGGGSSLYAGGQFGQADGVLTRLVARWTGSTWTAVANGISGSAVRTLVTAQFPEGPRLIAGGQFPEPANSLGPGGVAVWDGVSWSRLPGNINNGVVFTVCAIDDDYNPSTRNAVFVGGNYSQANGRSAAGIERWGCPFTPVPPCPADANGDLQVNAADLSVLLSSFGQSVAIGTNGDFNGDGVVNSADLSILLSQFGSTCS